MTASRTPLNYKDPVTLGQTLIDAAQVLNPTGATVNQPIHELANSAGAIIDPATDESVQAVGTALASILAKLSTKLSVSIDGDSVSITLPPGLALDATGQAAVTALGTLISDVASNHADLTAIHTDTGTTLHADLGAVLTRLGQPITTAAGTGTSTAALALETGGNLAALVADLIAFAAANHADIGAVVAQLKTTMQVAVSNLPATQAVSATALPLPAGAAKDTSLASILSALQAALTVQGAVTANVGTTGGLALDTSLQSIVTKLGTTLAVGLPSGASTSANQATEITALQAIVAALQASLPLPIGAATSAAQTAGNASLASLVTTLAGTLRTVSGGSAGIDYGANQSTNNVTIPNVGAAFAASGPYSGYALVKTIPAATRAYAEIDNLSAGQIVLIRDDGTAASGSAPANASLIVLNAAPGVGQPGGGGWSTTTFKGRVQIYAPAGTTPLITAFQD